MTQSAGARTASTAIASLAWVLAAAFLPLASVTTPVAGQVEESPSERRLWCFVADPAPSCRSYPVLEVQGVHAFSSSELVRPLGPPRPAFQGWTLEFNLGHAFNLTERWTVGGLVTMGTGTGGYDGARGRLRYRVSPDFSLEVDAGVIKTNLGSFAPTSSGPSFGLRANVDDVAVFLLRYDRVDVPAFEEWTPQTHSALSGGVGVAGPPAIAASGLIGLIVGGLMLVLIAGAG